MNTATAALSITLAALAFMHGLTMQGSFAAQPGDESRQDAGISRRYPNDEGINQDPSVLFADNFDAWQPGSGSPPGSTWDAVRHSRNPEQQQTLAIAGRLQIGSQEVPGKNVLVLSCWQGSPSVAGLRKHLGNYAHANENKGAGHEEIYVRYYQKLDENYQPERNHGANLGGRDLRHPDPWWVGMANTRDIAAHGYFYSGLQPYYDERSQQLYWGFYSYHLNKPDAWGDSYRPGRGERKAIEPGRWYCLERHMKLNSVDPLQEDGVEELWVDGQLAIRRDRLQFRKTASLKINVFELEVYYHGLPERYTTERPARVYFDNLVIATSRIGCLEIR